MTSPDADASTLSWPLTPESVTAWVSGKGLPGVTDALVLDVIASVTPFVQQCRPEFWTTPAGTPADPTPARVYLPDAEVQQAARMLVARVIRRRASPGGVEAFGDGGTAGLQYVARFDPEIERGLRTGAYAPPRIG